MNIIHFLLGFEYSNIKPNLHLWDEFILLELHYTFFFQFKFLFNFIIKLQIIYLILNY